MIDRVRVWWGDKGLDYRARWDITLAGVDEYYTFYWRNMVGASRISYVFAVFDWVRRSINYILRGTA